jgi:hypothetical protein
LLSRFKRSVLNLYSTRFPCVFSAFSLRFFRVSCTLFTRFHMPFKNTRGIRNNSQVFIFVLPTYLHYFRSEKIENQKRLGLNEYVEWYSSFQSSFAIFLDDFHKAAFSARSFRADGIWHKLVTDRSRLIQIEHSKVFMVIRVQLEEVNKKPRIMSIEDY